MGRKSKEEGMYVHMWLIHFAVQQKLTQHCKATVLQFKKKEDINGKEIQGRGDVCTHVADSLCCTTEINTAL